MLPSPLKPVKRLTSSGYTCLKMELKRLVPLSNPRSQTYPPILLQILGKKDILATLHPGAPEAESSSLGKETRKSLGVLHSLGAKAHAEAQESIQGGRG